MEQPSATHETDRSVRFIERRQPGRDARWARMLLHRLIGAAVTPLPAVAPPSGLATGVMGLRQLMRHANERSRDALAAHGLIAKPASHATTTTGAALWQ